MTRIKTNRSGLAKLRIRQGMSCAELASRVGVSQSFISMVEKGTSNPGPAIAKKIVEVLNVPYDCIFSIVEGE